MAEQIVITEISRLYLGRGIQGEPYGTVVGETDEQIELSVDLEALGQELDTALEPFELQRSFVWMPLTTTVGGTPDLVWDADNGLVPTQIPLED